MILALAQMLVSPGQPLENLTRAAARIAEAASAGADIVLLPEALDCGWTHLSAIKMAGGIPDGASFEFLRAAAVRHSVMVCAGLTERCGDRLFNAAVLIASDGRLLLHHRKLNELEFAQQLYSRGDRLGVAETSHGRIGLMICADAFADGLVISRALGHMGAQVILSPCAWAVPPEFNQAREPYGKLWLDSYGPPAGEFGMAIAGCSNTGPVTAGEWSGWQCIGCSMVVGPDGAPLARARFNSEEMLLVSLPLREPAMSPGAARGGSEQKDPDADLEVNCPRAAGHVGSASMRTVLLLLAFTLSLPAQTTPPAEAPKVEAPPELTEYMGRTIAKTMHWTGAEWLLRANREQEENAALMLEQLRIQPGWTVCDLGSGNGYHALKMAVSTGANGTILAVDIQQQMLDMLKARAEGRGINNIKPVLGEPWDPKLPPASCDLILLVDVYHEFGHPEQMLKAMHKALKPSGVVALVEFRTEDEKVPIKPEHKMSRAQIYREWQASGFAVEREFHGLPWQHLLFLRLAKPDEKPVEPPAVPEKKPGSVQKTE